MNHSIQKLAKSQLEIKCEVPAEEFQTFVEKAILKLGENVAVEGFRKGKAPKETIEKILGQEAILKEASQECVRDNYLKVVKDESLEPLGQPEISVLKLAINNPFEFKAVVTVLPEITIADYQEIVPKIKKREVKVTLEEIEKLKQEKERIEREKLRQEILDKIAAGSKMEIPEVLIDSEKNRMLATIKEQVPHIDILINNAGNAHGLGPIDKGDMNDFEKMIDTNLKGLLYVSQEIIPSMVKKKSGHIINLGSIAGKEVYPKGNVYCATKSAVDALSKAMRIDLAEHQIKVSNINPGLVETEFSLVRFKGNQELAKKTYQGFTPLTPFDIADLIYFIISRPVHVNLADCLILPLAQPCATTVIRESTREG